MALPEFNMRQLLEAGVLDTRPIGGIRKWVSIFLVIAMAFTLWIYPRQPHYCIKPLWQCATLLPVVAVCCLSVPNDKASEVVATAAKQCAQYYMNSRWLGGTLTNWKTISNSIKRYRELKKNSLMKAHKA